LTVLGLNSGTSADAVDAAVVRVSRRSGRVRVKCLATSARKMPGALAEQIFRVGDAEAVTLDDVIRLDGAVGSLFGRIARNLRHRVAGSGIRVDLVASHGQTVRHVPERTPFAGGRFRGTMQLGSLDRIAAATGLITVGDFRQAEVAIGGEGAPITTGAMHRLLASPGEARLIVNIGGMSNYFHFPKKRGRRPSGGDCGPGNAICDELTRELFDLKYDRDGLLARRGTVSEELLQEVRADPFFSSRTKSTGRERFGMAMAQRMIAFGRRRHLEPADLLATAVELTAGSIARCVKPRLHRDGGANKLYLTGGGRRNRFLVSRLSQHLPEVEISFVDELGIDGDFVEAVAYAVLGEAAIHGEALSTIHRGRRAILGRIAQPPR